MDEAKRKRHWLRRLEELEKERKKGWEPHWRALSTHFMPRRSRFLDAGEWTNDGSRLNYLEDSVGILARRTLSAGMLSGLTSPARPWFALSLVDERLAQLGPVRAWLHAVYESMVNVFNRSNFYDQMHLCYDELATFGTGVILVEADGDNSIRCRTLTVGEYCIDTNASGRVDTLYRRVRMTPRQIVEAWPDSVPERIKTLTDNDSNDWLTVLHAVEPNPGHREGSKDRSQRPWRSTYMMLEGGHEILEESGYYEFPALCPRWNTTASDVYGESPAMNALGDVLFLQRVTEDGRLTLEKEVNPPLMVAQSAGIGRGLDTSPGALNYISSLAQGQNAIQSLYQVRANLAAVEAVKDKVKQQIKEALYNDLFLMINNSPREMTATEVAERNGEKMILLGPVLDRLRSEMYQPLIERVFGIMQRQGQIYMAPPELQDQEIKIEFISILAQAQKQAGLGAINNTVAFVMQMAQASPTALDKLNIDEAIDEIAEMNGTPPSLIRSDEDVAAMRQQREEQMQQQQQMAMMQQGLGMAGQAAKAAKDAGLSAPELMAMQ
ncbi:MAG: head-tail connector protein, partial [Candidatus Adiutrix sp.]|nr:head-tail connector protein [Candidatus Adiutrix sp.]